MKNAASGLGVFCITACLAISASSLGCVYALQAPSPPFHAQVRIVAKSPEAYVLRVNARQTLDYTVPADGRLTVAIPSYGRGCSVYLFGVMKVSNGAADPLKHWTAEISVGGANVRTLSLRDLLRLPADSEGNRLLKVRG